MKAQFKYALRAGLTLRLSATAAVIVLNLVFGAFGLYGPGNASFLITAVVFSSLALAGVFVTNIIADSAGLQGIFGSPRGYLIALTPENRTTVLFARVCVTVCCDVIALFIGICGVVWQSFILAGLTGHGGALPFDLPYGDIIAGAAVIVLGYAYIFMLIIFALTLKNSVLFGRRGRPWLCLLCTAAAAWLLNLLNFALLPLVFTENWGLLFVVNIFPGFNPGFVLFILLAALRPAALLAASGALLERRINL